MERKMQNYTTVCTAAVTLLCLLSRGFAAYLDSSGSGETQIPPPLIRPLPLPAPEHPIHTRIRTVQPGTPVHYRNLTIYPLYSTRTSHQDHILSLDEALSHGGLTIRERDNARVGEILVRNDSARPLFLMTGEILTGGKQNRIIQQDTLLMARSDFTAIPVYCGEKARWNRGNRGFISGRTIAEPRLRKMAAQAESQDAIWKEIEGSIIKARVSSKTANYQAVYEDTHTQAELDRATACFRHLPGKRTVGLVAVANNRIVGCDLFSDPKLLSALWDKICRSYAMHALQHPLPRSPARINIAVHTITPFLNSALASRLTPQHAVGIGESTRISGRVNGHGLTWRDEVVHLALFAQPVVIRPMPKKDPLPPPGHRREKNIWN